MPTLSSTNTNPFITLKKRYDIEPAWYKKLIFPKPFAAAIISYNPNVLDTESAWLICTAYFNYTWYFQRNPSPCIKAFSRAPFIRACTLAYEVGLLNGSGARANFNALAEMFTPEQFRKYHDDETNFEDRNIWSTIAVLQVLKNAGLLNRRMAQNNFNIVTAHHDIWALHDILLVLTPERFPGTLTQISFDTIARHQHPRELLYAIIQLEIYGFFKGEHTQSNFNTMLEFPNPAILGDLLKILQGTGLIIKTSEQSDLRMTRTAAVAQDNRLTYLLARIKSVTTLNWSVWPQSMVSPYDELFTYLIRNTSLVSLNICNQFLGLKSEEDLERGFRALKGLVSLNLKNNNLFLLSGESLALIFKAIPKSVKTLHLGKMELHRFGLEKLIQLKDSLPHVRIVYLSYKEIQEMNSLERCKLKEVFPHAKHIILVDENNTAICGTSLFANINLSKKWGFNAVKLPSLYSNCAFFIANTSKLFEMSQIVLCEPDKVNVIQHQC